MTLLVRVRYILYNASLSKYFWTEAISTTCYLINQSPSTVIDFKTLEEVWSGVPLTYSYEYLFVMLIFM